MTLLQKTKEIVSNSIKSVIFIDEKALESYQKKSSTIIPEEELSINLNNDKLNIKESLYMGKILLQLLFNSTK